MRFDHVHSLKLPPCRKTIKASRNWEGVLRLDRTYLWSRSRTSVSVLKRAITISRKSHNIADILFWISRNKRGGGGEDFHIYFQVKVV